MGTLQRLYERLGIVGEIDPVIFSTGGKATASTGEGATAGHNTALVATGGTAISNVVDCKGHRRILIVAQAGTGASATASLRVQASTSTVGSDFAQLTGMIGTASGSATASFTAAQEVAIEVSADALKDNNYRYLRAILSVTQGNNIDAAIATNVVIIADNTYEPSSTAQGQLTSYTASLIQ